ncbi:hypothetical protein AH06_286 [Erwinia phage AH06]|nr:hypothetical protein AH06_286 [Erwinia phage AH06]
MSELTDLTKLQVDLPQNINRVDENDDVGDFSDLNDYLMTIIPDIRREKLISICQNLAALQYHQVQPDVDRLMMMANEGEAPSVVDDLTRLLFEHAYDLTKNMGFNWADDIEFPQLLLLGDVIEGAMLIDGMEDYGDLTAILDGDDSVEEKVVDIWTLVLDKDMHHLFDFIESIEPAVITGIKQVTTRPYAADEYEDVQRPLDFVVQRLVAYRPHMKEDGIAYQHVVLGGALGVDLESLITLYTPQLNEVTDHIELADLLLAFTLISNTPDGLVKSEAMKLAEKWIDDIEFINMVGTHIDKAPV